MVLKIDGTDIVPYIAYGGVKWQRSDVDGEGAGRMLDGTLERLNHPLIRERIRSLELREIQVSHTQGGSWKISCESMIGSATWILVPPVVNLIKPSEGEDLRFVEFFELVADAVANNV